MTAQYEADALQRYRDASEWQPIETAPLFEADEVILWSERWIVPVCAYHCTSNGEGKWFRPHSDKGLPSEQPTHWMPIPAPPTASG